MNKKNLKLLLLIILIFIPITTKAEENNFKVGDNTYSSIEEAIEAASNNKEELLFLKDIELKRITINETQDIILNLNGYNLNCDPTDLVPICIVNAGKLQIKGDNSIVTASEKFISNQEGADLIIESGNYNFKTTKSITSILNKGNLTINGGIFDFEKNLYGIEIDNSNGTNTTINNGTFNFKDINNLIYFTKSGKLNISGGIFSGDSTIIVAAVNMSSLGDKFHEISITGGTFDYIKSDNSEATMFQFSGSQDHNNTIINISNVDIETEGISLIYAAWVNLNITNSTLITDKTVIDATGGILTIGNNDNIIENVPIITSKSNLAIHSTEKINFYDGLITSTTPNPLGTDLNTLPSYNVIDNNNGTYTARLTKDVNDEYINEEPKEENDENINEEPKEENIDKNTEEIIENPKTGNRTIYLAFIVLIITTFIIFFEVNLKKIKE